MMVLTIAGAIFGSFVLSRILLWLTKRWQGGYTRIIVVHGLLTAAWLVTPFVNEAEVSSTQPYRSLLYAAAQVLWLLVDLFAHRGRLEAKIGAA